MTSESGDLARAAHPRAGRAGGGVVATILGALPAEEWTVFDDVRLSRHGVPLQVVVGPQGIFVIESRRPHRIPGRDALRPGGVRQDVVMAATRSALALGELSAFVAAHRVRPMLCFLRREVDPVIAGDVVVGSSRNLLGVLTSGPEVLGPDERRLLALELDAVLGGPGRAARRRRR